MFSKVYPRALNTLVKFLKIFIDFPTPYNTIIKSQNTLKSLLFAPLKLVRENR